MCVCVDEDGGGVGGEDGDVGCSGGGVCGWVVAVVVCGVMGTKGEWGVALSSVDNVEPEADERRFHKEIINNQRCPSSVACS